MPCLPEIQQLTFSHYKNHNTYKSLIGLSPSGVVTFVSDLFPGSISDRDLVRRSGMLALLTPGDTIMADWGFDIADDLTPLGVCIDIPPFLRDKQQLEPTMMVFTSKSHQDLYQPGSQKFARSTIIGKLTLTSFTIYSMLPLGIVAY